MKGIRLKHGVAFVEHEGITVRINADGNCDISPIMLPSLEWDLRTEPPDTWTYILESDITPNERKQITATVAKFMENIGE